MTNFIATAIGYSISEGGDVTALQVICPHCLATQPPQAYEPGLRDCRWCHKAFVVSLSNATLYISKHPDEDTRPDEWQAGYDKGFHDALYERSKGERA